MTTTTDENNNKKKGDEEKEEELTPEQRVQWLRDHGIEIVTPEERRATEGGQSMNTINENEGKDDNNTNSTTIHYVMIPADASQPIQELTTKTTTNNIDGTDILLKHLKPAFSSSDGSGNKNDVDLSLLPDSSKQLLSSSTGNNNNNSTPQVSQSTLEKVAQEGLVEVFNLVHPTTSNSFIGINIYLDEIGMLKRLPINHRATEYAKKCGYNPPPTFYGNIYIGRIKRIQNSLAYINLSFKLQDDIIMSNGNDAKWMQNAISDNLSYQMEYNQITGNTNTTQPTHVGTEDNAKSEDDGKYTWTQTEEEIELVVPLTTQNKNDVVVKSKDIKVKFASKSIQLTVQKEVILYLPLFEKVDAVDGGCTWTIEKKKGSTQSVVITLEKIEQALWPRIQQ